MKPSLLVCAPLALSLLAACAPRKDPKPTVNAADNAAVAVANEGIAAGTPSGALKPNEVTPSTAGKAAAALPVIAPAPAWKLKDLDGKLVSSDEFKGKVVVVDFWATWCPPCRAEIPGYVDLYKKYGKDRLAIVGVSLDESGPAAVKEFVKKFNINYPIVMGDTDVVGAFGGMDAIPTTFLIDRTGQIRDKKVGAMDAEQYERKIAAVLAEG